MRKRDPDMNFWLACLKCAYLLSEDGGEKMHRGIRAKYPNAGQGSHYALLSHLKNITVNFFSLVIRKTQKNINI
jgi:hypothetical protein